MTTPAQPPAAPSDAVPPETRQAEVLGRLLYIQSTLDVMSDANGITSFVGRALTGVPGVAGVRICVRGRLHPEPDTTCAVCHEQGALNPAAVQARTWSCALAGQPGGRVFPLQTARQLHGFLILTLADPATFAPYGPHLANIANAVANALESRDYQRRMEEAVEQLRQTRDELEERVTERTEALTAINAALRAEIRERVRAEAALRASEHKFETAFNASPDLILISTLEEGRYVEVNKAFERTLGYSHDEAVGRTSLELGLWADPADRQGFVEQLNADGEVHNMEINLRRKSGDVITCLISADLIDGGLGAGSGAGHERRLLAVARDITERKRVEDNLRRTLEELRRSNAELERFAYVASHDLQEPLRMVTSYTQLLAKRYQGRLDPEADEYIAYAVDGARHMKQLIQDLLTYSRLSGAARPLVPVAMDDAATMALGHLRSAIAEAEAAVEVGPLPTLTADETQMVELFQNLIGNAVKFRRPGTAPQVSVTAERINGTWRFAVADNGIGIDPAFHERIFQVFQRLHSHTQYIGTGIGLAICKKIVERHGGRLWVESTPGRGSTFRFTLPDRPPAEEGAPAAAAPARP